jgi:hypothetical protein
MKPRDWFAPDGFRGHDGVWGGDLVDLDTPFGARDKVQHVVAGATLMLALARWTSIGPTAGLVVVLVASVAWEALELVRYRAWLRRVLAGGTSPRPFAADLPSWRDVVATLAGAAAALWLL